MQQVSPHFLDALTGSHGHVVRVDAWRGGVLLSGDDGLPVAGGQVTITEGQAIRTAVSVTVADPDGKWTPQADGALSPYGSELHISIGIRSGALTELVSVCWSPITVAGTAERWQSYPRDDGLPAVNVSRGQQTEVTATDRAETVGAAKFMARTQPAASTVLAEIASLLRGVVPWRAPAGVADVAVPPGITYDDDRLKAVGDLAAVLDCELIFDSLGTATLTLRNKPDTGVPVWTVPVADGAVVSFARELNADATYNGVIVRGTAFNGSTLIGQAVLTEGPLAWNGPFGQVPFFVASATLGTQAAVDAAAVAELDRLVRQRSQILAISCVSNPALEVGDIVTIPAPKGDLAGRVTAITWPLTAGPMSLSVSVGDDALLGVT